MKLIYTQGFSKTEKLEWKPVVFNNIVQSFRLIFDAMQELDIPFENKDNEASSLRSRWRREWLLECDAPGEIDGLTASNRKIWPT